MSRRQGGSQGLTPSALVFCLENSRKVEESEFGSLAQEIKISL